MGGKSSTTTSKTELPPEIVQAYKGLLAQATPISQTPYQAYSGGVNGSGMEQNQVTGFNSIAGLNGASNGDFSNAAGALGSTATPTSASVGQYMSPYLSNVAQATMANMNEQNAEQQQGVLGNAAAQGALGGNRVGVAQSELARQQNLANQQTIAGLYNQGYNTALGAAQSDKQAALQAAQGYSNLGQTAMQTNLAQAAAQVGAGTQQQQWNYQQYQNAKSYPFETTSWLANIAEGLGSGQGTTTTKAPSGNTGSSILGGLGVLASLPWAAGGPVHADGRPHRAQGGVIPYSNPSGIISANNNNPPASNDNGYVPQVTAAVAGHPGPPPAQTPANSSQADAQNNKLFTGGMQKLGDDLSQKYPNGILAGAPPAVPATANAAPAPAPTAPDAGNSGILAKLGTLFGGGFADGGVARRGYDDGGYVDPTMTGSTGFDASTILPADLLALLRTKTPDTTVAPSATGVAAPKTDRIPTPNENLGDRFGPADAGPPVVGASNLADALAAQAPAAPDVASNAPSSGVIPVPTPRPDHYVDPQVVTQDYSSGVAPPLPPPTEVKDYPVAGVAASTAGTSVPSSGVVPTNTASKMNMSVHGAAQGIYDSFMNTVRGTITNPYGLAAVASTGTAESGFSPGNTYGSWADPTQHGQAGTAGGVMSWRADRLANMRSFVAKNGGDPSHPSPELQAQFFLQEDPSLVQKLNNAKSPAEAQQLMNNAWKFAGYNQPGGEAGRRIAMANNIAPQFEGTANGTVASSSGTPSPGVDSATTGSTSSPSSGVAPNGQIAGVLAPPAVHPGLLSHIFGGSHAPLLSDDARMALLSASLGIMSGTSPNFATNVGTGGQKGLETYMAKKQLDRENALAQSAITAQQGNLSLEGKRVDIAGQQLALEAKKNAADIGQTTALTGKTNLETQTGRYQQTVTPAGIIVRDMTDPNAPPRLTTWDDIQKNGPPSTITGSNEAVGASVAAGTAQSAPQRSAPAANAPSTPVATPITPIAAPAAANTALTRPLFQSAAPAHVPIDPRVMSPTGQQIVTSETTDALKEARTEYQGAANSQTQLAEMKHDLATLPNSTWTTPGTGFGARVQWAKAINTAVQGLGMQAPIDEQAVAAGEDLNKLTTRLGFELGKSMGSREAASIIDQSVSAVPGGANSPEGARRVIAGIEAVNQRKLDYYNFLQDWSAKTGGSIKGADEYFNKTNPPEMYALTSYVPTPAMEYLRQHPEAAQDFDAKYGMGRKVSQYVLGSQ